MSKEEEQAFPLVKQKVKETMERLAPPPQIVALEDLNIRLKKLNDNTLVFIELMKDVKVGINDMLPEGTFEPHTYTITESLTLNVAWSSFTIYNEGPGEVYIGVNEAPHQEVPIKANQSKVVPFMGRKRIKVVHIVPESGNSPVVQLWAVV